MRTPWAWLVVVGALAGCGVREVDVFGGRQGPPDGGDLSHRGCMSNDSCAPHEVCDKDACDAAMGRCRPRPVFCPSDRAEVCGCNGVTYWNDCLRLASGVASHTDGECAAPAACGGAAGTACPDPAAACARLLPADGVCAADVAGLCWTLPTTCPPPATSGGGAYIACGASSCSDVCTAMRSGLVHRRALVCP